MSIRNTVLVFVAVLAFAAVPGLSATLYVYDVSNKPANIASFDEEVFVASVQGIVNREVPRLFIINRSKEDTAHLATILQYEGQLYKAVVEKINTIPDFIRIFRPYIKGICVWDPKVPATLNAAITAAGAENLAIIRYDPSTGSLYDRLIASETGAKMTVALDFVNKFSGQETIFETNIESTGSKKCDVYLWAKSKYLDTGKAGPTLFYNCDGYRMKLFELSASDINLIRPLAALNIDYAVSKRAFAFDLSPFENEVPKDDPSQRLGEDARTFKKILQSAKQQAKGGLIQVIGFPHYEIKYSNQATGSYNAGGKNSPLELESAFVKLISGYNGYVTGSLQVNVANMSLHSLLPKPAKNLQNAGMSENKLKENGLITKSGKVADKTFLTFVVGDFDNFSSIYNELLNKLWQDKNRGSIPLTWAINPQLIDLFPLAFKHLWDTKSNIDYFAASASGAGLVNPGFLDQDGFKAWIEHCRKYYSRLDFNITANLVNGYNSPITKSILKEYASFSPSGILVKDALESGVDWMLVGLTPVLQLIDLPGNEDDAADAIHNVRKEQFPNFIAVRCPMQTPAFIKSLVAKISDERPDRNYAILDPYAFFDLLRRHLQTVSSGN